MGKSTQAQRIVMNISRVPKERLSEVKETILRKTDEKGDLKELLELIVVFGDGSIETCFAR